MRVFEILLLLIVTVIPFIKQPLLKVLNKSYLMLIIAATLVIHLIVEGWRWQMIPAYLLTIVLLWSIRRVPLETSWKVSVLNVAGYLLLFIMLIPAWLLPNVLPVFSLPEPTGSYKVGTQWIHLQTSMDESITKDPADKRELMIKAWYPSSAATSGKRDLYADHGNRLGFIQKYGGGVLPPSSINYLDRVKTEAYIDVPIVDEKFPVLVFSPGYGSMSSGYYAILTEIASHGYVIFSMNHTYESLGTTFPDGRIAIFDHAYAQDISENSMDDVAEMRKAFQDGLSFEERHPIVQEAMKHYFVKDQLKRWTEDMVYTLNQLEEWNNDGFFKDKLDLNKIGVFGHSRGGGAAGQLTITDSRIRAAANFDGLQWGEMIDTLYQVPYLHIKADWPADHEDIASHIYVNKSSDYFYSAMIRQSAHANFMDIPLMVPVRSLAQTGAVDPDLCIKITNELTLAFFDKHLKTDRRADPGKVSQRYDQLEMSIFKGDSVRGK